MNNWIVSTVIIVMCLKVNEACKETHIVFHNEISPKSLLGIDCKGKVTKSTRLGYKEDPPFIVAFKDNDDVFVRRKVDCVLSYEPEKGPRRFFNLEAYNAKRKRCGQLRVWTAREDGIWFKREHNKPLGWVLKWQTK
ncbi:unnamed protein product [Cochlearia groenlandica]